MNSMERIHLARDPEFASSIRALSARPEGIPLPPETAPPPEARLWVAGLAAWAAAGGDWLPLPLLPLVRRPGQGPWVTAPDPVRTGLFRERPLAVPHAWSTAALAAFLALGRGGLLPLAEETRRLEAVRSGAAGAALAAEKEDLPPGWWTLDLADWWARTALTPLTLGLLWGRPGVSPGPSALLPPAGPAHREALRQLLEGAAELGLVPPDLADRFTPSAWRGRRP